MNFWLRIVVPLSLCSVISCVPDVFSIVPKGIDSPQGRHVILQCTLKKEFQKSYNLTWLVNGKLITNGERRYTTQASQLHFDPIDKDLDSGPIQCQASSNSDENDFYLTDPIHFNIKWVEFGAVYLSSPAKTKQVLPGTHIILKCNVTGNPKPRLRDMKWYKDGVNVIEISKDFIVNKAGLTIPAVKLSDGGTYSLCIKNSMRSDCSKHNYKLQVRDITVPVLTVPFTDVTVRGSDDARLHCSFEAKPRPLIEWFKDDELITNKSKKVDGRCILLKDRNEDCRICVYPNGTLLIKRVKSRHEGEYRCRATGVNGNVSSATAEFNIAYIKDFDGPPVEEEYIELRSNVEKVCHPPEAMPPAEIIWMKDSIRIVVSNRSSRSSPRVTVTGKTLVISSAQKSDEGNYECLARNIAGNRTKTFKFLISTAPTLLSTLVGRIEKEGKDVVIKCNVIATPACTFSWTQNGTAIAANEHFLMTDNHLMIRSISMKDAAEYTCIASNTVGEVRTSAYIHVEEQLKFDPLPPETICIEKGKRTEIKCGARGAKDPAVRWTTDSTNAVYETKLNDADTVNTLIFPNASGPRDETTFVCTVSDEEMSTGIKTQTTMVSVGMKPKILIPPTDKTVFEGSDVSLDCKIDTMKSSEDLRRLRWIRRSSIVSHPVFYSFTTNGKENSRFTVMGNGSLIILKSQLSDTGYYTCSYRQCGFEVHANVTLNVAESIKPNPPDENPDEPDSNGGTSEYKKIQTVALAVGSSVAYLILTITIIVYCRRKKRHKKSKNGPSGEVVEEVDDEEAAMLNGSTGNSNGHLKKNGIPLLPVTHLDPDIENLQYDSAKLEIITVIGRGEFGSVFLSKAPGLLRDLAEDILVMVKQLEPEDNKVDNHSSSNGQISDTSLSDQKPNGRSSLRCDFFQEVRLLQLADHENIVRLLGVCSKDTESPQKPDHLITEYLEWGILKLCLQASKEGKVKKFNKYLKMRMCCQVAAGLEHLTKLGLVHQDVAARNCVISSKMLIKLTVLSLSKEGFESEYHMYRGKRVPVRWMAPETLFNKTYTTKSDIWAFGVTCWEIFTLGSMPFSDLFHEDFIQECQSEHPPTLPPLDNSKRITSLITKCCHPSPESRPEFHQIVRKLQSILGSEPRTAAASVASESSKPNDLADDATGPLLTAAASCQDDEIITESRT